MNENIKSDTAAAKLLGIRPTHSPSCHSNWVRSDGDALPCNCKKDYLSISLSDPATRDAMVQVLGEKHGASVWCMGGKWVCGWRGIPYVQEEELYIGETYEQAIRSACIAVVAGESQ